MLKLNILQYWIRCLVCALFLLSPTMADAQKLQTSDTLSMAWSTHVGPLDAHDYGANMMFAQAFVYEGLVNYGKGGTVLPALATAWEVSNDKKTYTFTLRQDVLFSDGSPFDANVVVKNFDAVMRNKERHDWMKLIMHIQSYKAVDTHTFSLTLHEPYAATLQELSFVRPLRFMSLNALEMKEKNKDKFQPVGTGAWIWQERKKGEYDLFVRNENYWGKKAWGQELPKKLLVKVIPDTEARAVALETGLIDILVSVMGDHGTAEISPHAQGYFQKKNDEYTIINSVARNTRFVALNSGVYPLNDIRVRKAIMRAINRKSIVEKILLGQELHAEQLMHTSLPHCETALPPYPHDVQAAEAFLEAAGWKKTDKSPYRQKDGKTLRLNLKFVGHESLMRTIAQVLQSDLASIGIELTLAGQEGIAFMESQRVGDFELIFGNSSGAPYAPFSYLGIMQVAGHPEYQAQRHISTKKELDTAMEQVVNTSETAEIKKYFNDIWRILHEAEVYVPLSYTVDKAIFKKGRVRNFTFSPVSYELLFQEVKIEKPAQ